VLNAIANFKFGKFNIDHSDYRKYMKKNKDIIICPKCFSNNLSPDKGFLPGGVEAFEFDVSMCNNLVIKDEHFC